MPRYMLCTTKWKTYLKRGKVYLKGGEMGAFTQTAKKGTNMSNKHGVFNRIKSTVNNKKYNQKTYNICV